MDWETAVLSGCVASMVLGHGAFQASHRRRDGPLLMFNLAMRIGASIATFVLAAVLLPWWQALIVWLTVGLVGSLATAVALVRGWRPTRSWEEGFLIPQFLLTLFIWTIYVGQS